MRQSLDGEWQYTWRIKLLSPPTCVAPCGDDVLVLNTNGVLKRVDPLGERVWQRALPLWSHAAPSIIKVFGDTVVAVAARAEAPMTGIDCSSGEILWQTAGTGDIVAEPLIDPQSSLLICATRDVGLSAIRMSDGLIVDRHTEFAKSLVGIAPFMEASSVVVLTEYGEDARIILYDVAQRRIIWTDEIGKRGAVASAAICGDVLIAQDLSGRLRAWKWEDWR
jgi:hypothetical protein